MVIAKDLNERMNEPKLTELLLFERAHYLSTDSIKITI
jgi:hypothetical protein